MFTLFHTPIEDVLGTGKITQCREIGELPFTAIAPTAKFPKSARHAISEMAETARGWDSVPRLHNCFLGCKAGSCNCPLRNAALWVVHYMLWRNLVWSQRTVDFEILSSALLTESGDIAPVTGGVQGLRDLLLRCCIFGEPLFAAIPGSQRLFMLASAGAC